jgi:hypothetical protein
MKGTGIRGILKPEKIACRTTSYAHANGGSIIATLT